MSNSSLATILIPAYTGNYTKGRESAIKEITIHHMAARWTAQRCGESFQVVGRQGSSHYGIGYNGEIAQYVDESDTAWTNSNWSANCRAVTIETANSQNGGNWPVSDEALNSLIRLVADIAIRNNLGLLVKGQNLTWHQLYSATACVPVETELLTENGWVQLKDIRIGDRVASASLDDLSISFEEVYAKVPEKFQDTYTNNDFTATKDHRMVYSIESSKDKYRIDYYGNLIGKNNYIPLAGYNRFDGLDLSDDMIRFYVAVQADGHYMKENDSYYGLEFHFKKERKIKRIQEVLDALHFEYSVCNKSDGSVSIRIWNTDGINIVNDICERYLEDKCFSWKWLGLNREQAKLFLDEILEWDGCRSGKKYTSRKRQNVDIVNAIASLNGVGSRVIGDDVLFRNDPYVVLNGETVRNRHRGESLVSCVSVKTGLILVRQHGKTFIIGNCPGPYLLSKIDYIIQEANKIIAGDGDTIVTRTPVTITYQVYDGAWLGNITGYDVNDAQIGYAGGTSKPVSGVYANASVGNVYYRVHTKGGKWLGEIKNREDYAGILGQPIDGFMIKSDSTRLTYRAHDKTHGWLSEISGYDMNDANNGYAGWTGYEIDAIMIRADDIVTTTVVEKPKAETPVVETPREQMYRVRKSWDDPKSQAGAYKNLQSAIDLCDRVTLETGEVYHVYDVDGNIVHSGKLPEHVPTIEPEIEVEHQPEVEVEEVPPVVEPELEVKDEPKEEIIEEPKEDESVIEEEPKKGLADLIAQLLISIAKVIKSLFK